MEPLPSVIMHLPAIRAETFFTLNATFLVIKPYYLSNLGKLLCQPYYIIVSALVKGDVPLSKT